MPIAENEQPKISVADFIKQSPRELEIEILAGHGGSTERFITTERIQKLGLALAGFSDYVRAGRVQIVGRSEVSFLAQQSGERKIEAIKRLDLEKISCILVTKNLEPPAELIAAADENGLPVLRTKQVSSQAMRTVSTFLIDWLAPQATIHGVLVGMYGIGVLLTGESGIGKSECALDLIASGHQLVSDDAVVVKKIGGDLIGSSPELTREHLEVRGLGIVNVRSLYGVWSVVPPKKIVLCIEFQKWSDALEIDRLGLDAQEEEILGVKIAKYSLPVSAGRNLATLVEAAVRVFLLKISGVDAARILIERHANQLRISNYDLRVEEDYSDIRN